LPGNLKFVSLSKPINWICTTPMVGEGGTVSCTTPSLAASTDDVFILVVNVPSNTPSGTSYTNIATISSTTYDPNDENNSAPATTTVGAVTADLSVVKTVNSEFVNAGENLTYTITVYNIESFNVDNAKLIDELPEDTTFVSLSAPNTWTCTTPNVGDPGIVTCTNPSLAANSESVFTLVVKVPANAEPAKDFTNTATVSTTMPETNEENNIDTATATVGSADLEVAKVDTPDPVNVGANLTYTITVVNNGPVAAAAASLSDTLPAGTTFVSLSAPNDWMCTPPAVGSGGTVNCLNNSFALGSAVFTLVVKVDSSVSAGTVLTNTATASSTTPDTNLNNNGGTATTTVVNFRGWTTTGSGGGTEDESNPAQPTYANFTAGANAGSPAGTYVLRYNIQATDGLKGPGTNTRLRVRFRDDGTGSRVTVAIMRSPISGGIQTMAVFDSDTYEPNSGFQTQELLLPTLVFDFTQNTYWLEITMTKADAANQPGFGSAQINRQ
jgi:uncharacterized repeat protein (TIGR01451 family)